MVFPLKAFPWMVAIALIAMGMESQSGFGALGVLAGLALLAYLVKQKWFSKSGASSAGPSPVHKSAPVPPARQTPPPVAPARPASCPSCKAAVPAGMAFCMQCGTRVQ